MLRDRHGLVNFLNHGTMPFVGRDASIGEILAFWKEGREADRMRSMLMTAEAGMGKSRLIEELLPRIRREDGIALHVKLLPESATRIAPLLAQGVRLDAGAQRILQQRILQRRDIPDDLSSLLPLIRKLARLRPLLVLFEDLHVLHELPADDFATLVDLLSDEPLTLLCIGRPVDCSAYALLEPSLIERITLPDLSIEDISLLWQSIFPARSSEQEMQVNAISEALHSISRGSPIALRTILREGITSGAIRADGMNSRGMEVEREGENVYVDIERLKLGGKTSALQIGMGMTAQLDPDERAAAGALALLGEAFARETARLALPNGIADQMIDRLIYRGLLHLLRTPVSPLAGMDRESVDFPASKSLPLGFTHTLLHQYCVESAGASRRTLEAPLAANAPLYSLIPVAEYLRALANGELEREAKGGTSIDNYADDNPAHRKLYAGLFRCANIIHELVLSPSWMRAKELVLLLEQSILASKDQLDPEEFLDLYVTLLYKKAIIGESEDDLDLWQSTLAEARALTESPSSFVQARLRVGAIAKNPDADWGNPDYCRTTLAEVESLAATWPELRLYFDYRLFMCLMGIFGTINNDPELVVRAEEYYERVIAETDEPHVREMLDIWFLPVLMQKFDSAKELGKRLEQFHLVEGISRDGGHATHIADHTIMFLFDTGNVDLLLRRIEESLELFRVRNVMQLYVRARVKRIVALGGIGIPSDELEREAHSLRQENVLPDYTAELLAISLAETLWLRGDSSWKKPLVELSPESLASLNPSLRLLLEERFEGEFEREFDRESSLDNLQILSTTPLLRLRDLVSRTATIALLKSQAILPADTLNDRVNDTVKSARSILEESFLWCRERTLPGFMDGILLLAEGIVEEKKLKGWRPLADDARREREAMKRGRERADERVYLSVFGSLRIDDGIAEPRKISGGRMKIVLGLMAANVLAEHSLSLEEFALLAAEDELADADSARNNLYVRLHSLRKILGAESIISETGEAPKLNRERVRVDLIEIHNMALDARKALARGNPGKAALLLRAVLNEVGGEVLFPGLYDSFFDAARDDFDVMLRDTIVLVVDALRKEGDHQSVAGLLEMALRRTGDDEELAEMLYDSLASLGRKSQAERVRRSLNRTLAEE